MNLDRLFVKKCKLNKSSDDINSMVEMLHGGSLLTTCIRSMISNTLFMLSFLRLNKI